MHNVMCAQREQLDARTYVQTYTMHTSEQIKSMILTFINKKMTDTNKPLQLNFAEEYSCCHEQAASAVGCFFLQLYVVTDGRANFFCSFLSHALRNTYCSYPENECQTMQSPESVQASFMDGLPSGLSYDNLGGSATSSKYFRIQNKLKHSKHMWVSKERNHEANQYLRYLSGFSTTLRLGLGTDG